MIECRHYLWYNIDISDLIWHRIQSILVAETVPCALRRAKKGYRIPGGSIRKYWGQSSCPVGSDFGQDLVSRIALPEIKGRRETLVHPNNNNEWRTGRKKKQIHIYIAGWMVVCKKGVGPSRRSRHNSLGTDLIGVSVLAALCCRRGAVCHSVRWGILWWCVFACTRAYIHTYKSCVSTYR